MERILQTDSPALIAAYETQVQKLEERKLALAEQARSVGRPLKRFDEAYRTACEFLATPCKLWLSERMEDKRTVLKLAFAGRVPYCRKEGYRTAVPALPFKVRGGFGDPKCGMVEPQGETLNPRRD